MCLFISICVFQAYSWFFFGWFTIIVWVACIFRTADREYANHTKCVLRRTNTRTSNTDNATLIVVGGAVVCLLYMAYTIDSEESHIESLIPKWTERKLIRQITKNVRTNIHNHITSHHIGGSDNGGDGWRQSDSNSKSVSNCAIWGWRKYHQTYRQTHNQMNKVNGHFIFHLRIWIFVEQFVRSENIFSS